MLKILEGGFYSVLYSKVKEEIQRLVTEGKKVYLLVPEQAAVTAERDIMPTLPHTAPLNFEVTNFTRLANTAMRMLGGIGKSYSDSAKETLIMWRTLTELSPVLTMTAGAGEINDGLVSKALGAIAEIKSVGALPDELIKISESEELSADGKLRQKLSDAAKISALYEKLLSEKYQSTADDSSRLYKKLSENPQVFEGEYFFVWGFTSFTEPQIKVISELMKRCTLSVCLTLTKEREDDFLFTEIRETKSELIRIAKKSCSEISIERIRERKAIKNPILPELADLLWTSKGIIDNDSLQNKGDAIRIFEASDVYEECEFIGADIKREVMERGASYSDFAIISRDAEEYTGIIDTALSELGIPSFLSKRTDLSSFEAVKLIYTAFEAINSGFSRESVVTYAKCTLSGISREECDEFELYTEKWQISGSRFTDGLFWNMSPDGYEARKSEDEGERLLAVNATRDRLITPLLRLWDNTRSEKTVLDFAKALFTFLSDISFYERLMQKCDTLLKIGEADAARDNARLYEIIISSLDALVEVLGGFKTDAKTFISQLKVVLNSTDVGKIPAYSDVVTVGSADMLRLGNKKRVYLIGVNEGRFPAAVRNRGFFTERDRITLEKLGVNIRAKDEISAARELFFFSRAFAIASEAVTLTVPKRDASLAAINPAPVLKRITTLLGSGFSATRISDIPPSEKIYSPKAALSYIDRTEVREALIESGRMNIIKIAEAPISNLSLKLNKESIESLYPGDISLSQTRIDDYISCPLLYFLKYNLKLSENEKADFDARNIGTFVHAVLENLFLDIRQSERAISDISDGELEAMLEKSAESFINETLPEESSKRRTEILIKRLKSFMRPIALGLCEELRGCKFVPEFFELKIGGEDENSPRPVTFTDKNGKRTMIWGSVDRVDAYKSGNDVYVRVIDYKTGKKSFSPSDISEGRNLQMFLYLKAIAETDNENLKKRLGVGEGGRIIPAGVIYIQTDMSEVKIDKNDKALAEEARREAQKRRGMLLNDAESISAMNPDYIPIKYKKGGEPDARSEKLLYTEDGWREINEIISEKVLEVSDGLRSGNISPARKTTKENHCDTCKFKVICRRK